MMNIKANIKICTKCKIEKPVCDFALDAKRKEGLSSHCKRCKADSANNYYLKNDATCKNKMRTRHLENKESINSSRRKHADFPGRGVFNKLNPNHFDFGASLRKPFGESSFLRLVRQYKANAIRRGKSFSLTHDEIRELTKANCVYCGAAPSALIKSHDSHGHYEYNGIDRVDSTLGYSMSNCVTACGICNRAKSNMPFDEWMEWIGRIVIWHEAARQYFKKTIEKDEVPKSMVKE